MITQNTMRTFKMKTVIRSGYLYRSTAVANLKYIIKKDLFLFSCAQHALSYPLI